MDDHHLSNIIKLGGGGLTLHYEQLFRFFERKCEFWPIFQKIIEFVTKDYVTSVLKNGQNSHFSGHSQVNNRPIGQREPVGKEPNSIDICHKLNLGRLFY